MGFIRHRRNISITVPGAAPDEVIAAVRAHGHTVVDGTHVSFRVSGTDRLRARLPVSAPTHMPPHLTARIVAGDRGTVLTGQVRESYLELVYSYLYYGLAGLLALAVLPIVAFEGGLANPGLYVCSVGALLLGHVGFLTTRQRRRSFAADAPDLERAARLLLGLRNRPPGTGTPHPAPPGDEPPRTGPRSDRPGAVPGEPADPTGHRDSGPSRLRPATPD